MRRYKIISASGLAVTILLLVAIQVLYGVAAGLVAFGAVCAWTAAIQPFVFRKGKNNAG